MTGLRIAFTGIQRQYNNLRTEILDATDTVLRSGHLMSGNYTAEFENWLAKRNHSQYAVTCHSGTQALEIIAEYYRTEISINPPKISLPALTFPATANAFARAGWNIEFVDTDAYGIINYQKFDRSQSRQAVCVVGLYGHAVNDHAYFYTDLVIEDGAQHWLADNCRRKGKATAISFDPTKNLANFGNGGAVVTDDHQLAQFARGWAQHGKPLNHGIPGSNSRMSEIDCAQMMIKTRYIDSWQKRRQDIVQHWLESMADLPLRCLIDQKNFHSHCYHKFVIEVDNRDQVAKNLRIRGVDTKIHYDRTLWELPAFENHSQPADILSGAGSLSRRCLSLPIYPELTDLEVEYISDQVRDLYA